MVLKRKIASKRIRQKIQRRRIVKGKRAPVFFGSKQKNMHYLFEVASAVEKKYPIGEFLHRVKDPSQRERERERERRGAAAICSEMLRIYLAEELRNPLSARPIAVLKNTLLRIFKRSYRPHREGAYFDLLPEEKKLIETMGQKEWEKVKEKLWDEAGEISHALVFASSTPERHCLFWTASHLTKIMQEIEKQVFYQNEE